MMTLRSPSSRGDLNTAKSWLEYRGWHKKHGYAAAWAHIRSMLRDVWITSGWVRSDHEQHPHGLSTTLAKWLLKAAVS